MKTPDKQSADTHTAQPEQGDVEEPGMKVRPRAARTVPLSLPVEALTQLEKVAERRDMSVQGLLKFYVGQGLREDVARLFSEHVLETAAQVLARHSISEEERAAILREIRQGATA